MTTPRRTTAGGDGGYALVTVVVFTLVIVLMGMSFFAVSAYETKGAIYRQNSSSAFYLADAGLERTRGKFLEDRTWRDGWSADSLGAGTYDVAVTDTTYPGAEDVVHVLSTGRVGIARRAIEVFAVVPPTAYGLGILVLGDADVGGDFCLEGTAHVVGDADFGPSDVHLTCGDYTSDFEVTPPPIYTDPDHFPDATYYYVRGTRIGGTAQARIFDRDGIDITTALGDSLVDVTSYNAGQELFTFDFDSHAEIQHYFDDATGVFRRTAGDVAVVVNFGEAAAIDPPGVNATANLIFDGSSSTVVNATIVNARFTGVTEEQRSDEAFWMGGLTTVRQIIFEPYRGIALIARDFQKVGGSHTQIGSPDYPALIYITRDVVGVNSNFELYGAFVVLGDWNSTGSPHIVFDRGFIEHLPGYLVDDWADGVSGTLRVLKWREMPSASS